MKPVIQFFLQNRFRKEIALVILIKLIALFVLWQLFFSHPLTNTLNSATLQQHYLLN